MALFRREKKPRDRPETSLMPLWGAISGLKARKDLTGSEAIYSAVARIASTMACMPLHLYCNHEILCDDARERAVSYAPNANQTPFGLKLAVEVCRNTAGRAYIMILTRDDGVTFDHLDLLDPARVEPLRNRDNGELWYRITLDDGKQCIVHSCYVIALYHMSSDGTTGISPIDVLSGTLTYDRKIQEISLNQLESVRDSVVLTIPTNINREKRDEKLKAFQDAYRSSRGHIIVLDGGVTAEMLKGSAVDPKVLDVDNITKRKVAAVYNMPPRMLGDASSSGYSTSEQDMSEFLKLTILPIVKQWEDALNRRLLTYDEVKKGYAFRFDMEALKRGDTDAMSNKHSRLVRTAGMTPNESRAEDGRPPVEYGDELLISRDVIPLRLVMEHPELLLAGKTDSDK